MHLTVTAYMNMLSLEIKLNANVFYCRLPSDIDECVTGKNLCPYNRQCVNTFGSYFCKCQEGYDLKYVDGKYDCVGKLYEVIGGSHLSKQLSVSTSTISLSCFQTMMSVEQAPTSAATMQTAWTHKVPTGASASLASEGLDSNVPVSSKSVSLWRN